jgi:uncharacterized protein YdaT
MDWIFENFRAKLENLNPQVREKAVEIAKTLMKKDGFSDEEAIKKAIVEAEEWFLDSEG